MKRPAIFFDRDNTLIVSDGYLGDASKVQLIEGAADAVALAHQLGYAVVVFSNQSGVARGMFSEDDVRAVNARTDELLKSQNVGALIDRHEFCPTHPDAVVQAYRRDADDRRKPGAGMIHSAADALDLDLSKSRVIGDAPRDIEAGHAAGCRTILIQNQQLPPSPASQAESQTRPSFVAATLRDALAYIQASRSMKGAITDSQATTKLQILERQGTTSAIELILSDIRFELRRLHEPTIGDFSVTKLLAGISQVVSVAIVFLAYLNSNPNLLWFGIWIQCLTIALLIMGRQK